MEDDAPRTYEERRRCSISNIEALVMKAGLCATPLSKRLCAVQMIEWACDALIDIRYSVAKDVAYPDAPVAGQLIRLLEMYILHGGGGGNNSFRVTERHACSLCSR
ncbi:hypothetical protein J6590_052217 [Homalodisca vitripennis]|nr:hypothetical protein J6590_052217 [Homalodisca vitripennis]